MADVRVPRDATGKEVALELGGAGAGRSIAEDVSVAEPALTRRSSGGADKDPSPLTPTLALAPALPTASSAAASQLSWSMFAPDSAQAPLRGGFGSVYKARWEKRRVDVAIKLLRASALSPAEYEAATAALEREAEALRLASEGGTNRFVVAQFGIARGPATPAWASTLGRDIAFFASQASGGAEESEGGELFGLVTEWVAGGTLYDRLHGSARWAAGTAERLLLLERTADAVALLHSMQPRSVVHADIKSANVLLSERGAGAQPRLADFGLSEVRQAAAATRAGASTARPAAGDVGGTFAYMAPEMYRRGRTPALAPSTRTDVYALSTLCWEVIVGELPWEGFTETDRVLALLTGEEDGIPWSKLPEDVPAALRTLLARGVDIDREKRPSARELCEGLRAARELLESAHFDVFLSHAWGENGAHAPVTTVVLRALRDDGRHVWVDKVEMGHDKVRSMREGVAASTLIVALVSKRYASRPDCMLELREALRLGKPVVSCLVEPMVKWWPPTDAETADEREMAAAVNPRALIFADLRRACAAGAAGGWYADAEGITLLPAQRELVDAHEAVPSLLKLVRDVLVHGSVVTMPPVIDAQLATTFVVSTLAGNGTKGFADGALADALFNEPIGIAILPDDSIVVADSNNHCIRHIRSDTVLTLAGRGGEKGFSDGPAAEARFYYPSGLAVSEDGSSIFVADFGNNRVRSIDIESGSVTTFAGSGEEGGVDGNSVGASFDCPRGLALGPAGILYVTEMAGTRVRAISPAGDVTTFAGSESGFADGAASAARFSKPAGIAVDATGVVYVADEVNLSIRRISDGVVSTLAGSNKVRIATGLGGFADGAGASAVFYSPQGLSLDRATGKLFVGDNSRIRIIDTSTGAVSTLAGSKTRGKIDGAAASATFTSAYDIALDSKGGIIVADRLSHSLRRISRT